MAGFDDEIFALLTGDHSLPELQSALRRLASDSPPRTDTISSSEGLNSVPSHEVFAEGRRVTDELLAKLTALPGRN